MSDELTIDGGVSRELITGLVDLARRVDAATKASEEMEESAKKLPSAWEKAEAGFQKFLGRAKEFWESSSRFGEAYRNIKEPVADIAEGLLRAAESTARLAAEQGRLDRVQADLGVSLRTTQEYAGGFARETDLATAAVTLQTQGIRVHQRELDALARIAMHRAIATGKEFGEVLENATETVTEGGEELGKLAPELLRVASGSHTAGERLAAMVQAAERMGPATRDAASEFQRYTATVEGSQRLIAAGFVQELTHLDRISGKTRDARDATEEWERSMRAVGQTVALLGSGAVNALGAIAGTIATAVATIPALLEGAGAAVAEFTMNPQNIANGTAGRRASAAFRASMNNDTLTSLTDFVEARVAALEALAGEGDSRTSADPETARGPDAAATARDRRIRNTSNDGLAGNDANAIQALQRRVETQRRGLTEEHEALASNLALRERDQELATAAARTQAERLETEQAGRALHILAVRDQDELDRRQRDTLTTLREQLETQRAAGGSENMRNALADRIRDVHQDEVRLTREIEGHQREITRLATEGARAEEERAEALKEARYNALEEAAQRARSDEKSAADELKGFGTERAGREAQLAGQTDLLEGLFGRQRNALQQLRDTGVDAYDSLMRASSEWVVALALGEAGATDAFQRALFAKSKQIAVENVLLAGQSLAEGLYYSFTAPPIAATKFAAAAKFGAVAIAAGGAALALNPGSGSGASGGGGNGQRAAPLPSNRDLDQSSGRSQAGAVYNFNFGGGVIGTDRELAAHFGRIMNDRANGFELNARRVTG